eukprot:362458-Chlamydomonas_euryale.AAC.3
MFQLADYDVATAASYSSQAFKIPRENGKQLVQQHEDTRRDGEQIQLGHACVTYNKQWGTKLHSGHCHKECGALSDHVQPQPSPAQPRQLRHEMDQMGSTRSYPTSTTARCRKDRKAQGPEMSTGQRCNEGMCNKVFWRVRGSPIKGRCHVWLR